MLRSELMAQISTSEFYEWMVLEKIEPFGECGDYLRSGIIASTIANVNRGRNQKAFKPSDFMPKFDDTAAVQSQGQIRDALIALKSAQDETLKAKAKREQQNADTQRVKGVRTQTERHRPDRPKKGAR